MPSVRAIHFLPVVLCVLYISYAADDHDRALDVGVLAPPFTRPPPRLSRFLGARRPVPPAMDPPPVPTGMSEGGVSDGY